MAIMYQTKIKYFNETSNEEIEKFIANTDEITAEQNSSALLFAFQEEDTISTGKIIFEDLLTMWGFFRELKSKYNKEFIFFSDKAFKYGKFIATLPTGVDSNMIFIKKEQGIISYKYRFRSKEARDIFAKKNKLN